MNRRDFNKLSFTFLAAPFLPRQIQESIYLSPTPEYYDLTSFILEDGRVRRLRQGEGMAGVEVMQVPEKCQTACYLKALNEQADMDLARFLRQREQDKMDWAYIIESNEAEIYNFGRRKELIRQYGIGGPQGK